VILPEEARRDDRAAGCRGGQPAVRRACCPEPALRSAQEASWAPVSQSVRVSSSVRVWRSAPALPVVRAAPPVREKVSP